MQAKTKKQSRRDAKINKIVVQALQDLWRRDLIEIERQMKTHLDCVAGEGCKSSSETLSR